MKKTKKAKTMIGQMTLITTCIIVAAFFIAGNLVLAQQYGLTSSKKSCQVEKKAPVKATAGWRR
jgi:hypothetical protein